MNTAVGAFARVSLLLCAGFAGSALAQSDTQSNSSAQCAKTRCFTPSCYKQYAGGYYMSCPDGHHPLPKSEQTVPTEADRNEQAELKQSLQKSGPPSDPAAVQAVTCDWELRMSASPKPLAVLHLRPGVTGSLEGTLEQSLGAQPARVSLQDLEVSGTTFSYTTPNGKQFRGTLSGDRQLLAMRAAPRGRARRVIEDVIETRAGLILLR
jgi:hypothetical protein